MIERRPKFAWPSGPPRSGLLVAFEGIDGSGKTTVARTCCTRLNAAGHPSILLKEPTDGPIGTKIRRRFTLSGPRDPQEEFEMFLQDRAWNVENNILPALQNKTIVCIDRYYISSMAYQGALGLDIDAIQTANEAIAPEPDLILLFDLSVKTARERIKSSRPEGANCFEEEIYQAQVQANFRRLKFRQLVKIDAEQPLSVIQENALAEILCCLQSR